MEHEKGLNTDETLDELKSKHGKEKKELVAKVTSLKHGLTKNDKKRKKEVSQQCEQMESEMKQRHEKEMAELERRIAETKMEKETECDQSEDAPMTEEGAALFFKELKLTKSQLKKEKKRTEKANARNKAEAEDAENAINSRGNLENEAIRQILNEKELEIVEVSPDGDCLYSAMAHQTNVSGLGKFSASEMRRMAADYIQKHRDDFLPFLANENREPSFEDAHFDEYCSKVARMCVSGGSWGGAPEIRALSSALCCPIEVIQADGGTIKFGEMFSGNLLTVTFHKFAFALGEHYNSTKPIEFDN